MTTTEYLLILLNEEGLEVGQRVTKALRFGLKEIQPEQSLTNRERLIEELIDFMAIVELLEPELKINWNEVNKKVVIKKNKVRKYLEYSKQLGTISDSVTPY